MMKNAIYALALAGVLNTVATTPALAQGTMDDRLSRIERILENQSGSDLVLQLQRMQSEMQDLRGMVESQKLDIEKLQRQQRDQYLDIDSRLGAIKSSDQSGAVSPGAAGGEKRALPEGVVDASGGGLAPPPVPAGQAVEPVTAPTPATPGSSGVPSLPTPETVGGNERDAYAKAFGLLKERKYDDAKVALTDLLNRYPQGQYADNARYWLAETYYMQRDYPAALEEFDTLVQSSPKSPKVPSAMLKIGYIQFEQKAFDQARGSLEKVISDYPNTTEARLARSRLERIR